MKWTDYKKRQLPDSLFIKRIKTEIECPRCGKFVWKKLDVILTSFPPQYQYECDCGWVDYDFK